MKYRFLGIEVEYTSTTHPAGLVAEHEQALAEHEARIKGLRERTEKKGAEIAQALSVLQADLATVKALESRLG